MLEHASTLAVLAILALAALADRRRTDDDTPQDKYARGEIDHAELQRRVAFQVDDRNDRIREVVETVNGVGPETGTAIAAEYDSLEELRRTDRERLEDVYGVGASTADAVLERVRSS